MRKEITLTVTCSCGFWIQRVFHTNKYGYFEIPDSHCPDCFSLLMWVVVQPPMDVVEDSDGG